MDTTVLGYFHDRAKADAAYEDLVEQGVPTDAISLLGRGAEERAGPQRGKGASVAVGAGVDEETARYYDARLREGGVLLAVRTDVDRADAVRGLLAGHDADLCNLETVAGTPDWPGDAGVDLTRNDRRQYLSAVEDMARTTAARDPDELLPVDENSRQ